MHWMPRASLVRSLEEIVILNHEVVEELDAKVALRLDVVLHVDQTVYFDVDGKAVGGELR